LPNALVSSSAALAEAIGQPDVVRRVVGGLGARERAALALVQASGGRIAAAVLEREFGVIRDATRFPNPRAYLLALNTPPSPTELLFLFGLLQPIQNGAQRSYAITANLLPLLPPVAPLPARIIVMPVDPPIEPALASSAVIEQELLDLLTLAQAGVLAVTPSGGLNKASLLRFVRHGQPGQKLDGISREEHLPFVHFLRMVAQNAELVRPAADSMLRPTRAALDWLRAPQIDRARTLLTGWVTSPYDELVRLAGMTFQRAYGRDLARARRALLRMLGQVPANTWVSVADFTAAVKTSEPDYGRPSGHYDTWGVQSYARVSLDGFAHWDAVEGQQIRQVIGFSLYWLGLVDVSVCDQKLESFRLTELGAALLQDLPLDELPVAPLIIQPSFEVLVPPGASPYARFQIGRVAERASIGAVAASYRLTKRALQAELARGTPFEDVERFLTEAAGRPLPQNVAATLHEWAAQHGQINLRTVALLETRDAALLQQLRHDKRLRLPEGEQLGDAVYAIRPGDAAALIDRLGKAGYGISGEAEPAATQLGERDLTVVMAALEFYAAAADRLGTESDASAALRRRVARLLGEVQLNRAYQSSGALLRRLDTQLGNEQ
ncbi:MAG: helicase-associated domain-containing protein, partial [Roseiflexaceae bacterium]|nr:helicase-associated domain-containing protein [Roseiflexaceae bacterium]